jgi:drug/metabolite transporter (DMT)-like permease
MLVALAAIWGSSFMFIKVAVRELEPGVVVFGRVFVATLTLLPAVSFMIGWRRLVTELRRLYAGSRLAAAPPIVTSLGTLAVATVTTLPFGIAQLPDQVPSWKVIGSVVALGSLGLSVAYLLYFGLIAGAGASYAVLVTYLVPAIALGYGAVFLDEQITASAVGGLLLILAGVALGTGSLRLRRRVPVAEAP